MKRIETIELGSDGDTLNFEYEVKHFVEDMGFRLIEKTDTCAKLQKTVNYMKLYDEANQRT